MKPESPNAEGSGFLPAIGLGVGVFAFHAVSAPGGLFWLDAGDFVTASCELGVPHPTGYPLYVLLGKLACAIPVGSAAFRVSLLSAAFAGLVSALLALLMRALRPAPSRRFWLAAAAVASLALWTTDVAGLAGRTPDVYALHVLLTASALWLTLRLGERGQLADWLLLGLVIGLGLSNHAEYRLFAPIFVAAALVFAWPSLPQRRIAALARRLGGLGSAVVVGLLPYLYLPLASRRGPYHAWGQPDTIERLWEHVSGLTIRLGFETEFLNLSWVRLRPALATFGSQLWSDFGELLILAPVALVVLLLRRRALGLLVLLLVACDVFYAVAINPMGLEDHQNGATTWFAIALTIGVGSHGLADWVVRARPEGSSRPRTAAALAVLVAVAMLALMSSRWDRLWLPASWGAEDLTFDGLQSAPEGSVVLTATESVAAARLYLVGIGGLRPDLQALHMTELSDSRLLVRRHIEGPFPLAPDDEVARWRRWGPGATVETYLERLATITEGALASGRAVVWGSASTRELSGRWDRIAIGFPFHRLHPESFATPPPLPETVLPPSIQPPDDPWGRRWVAQYANVVGNIYVHRAEPARAATAFLVAAESRPDWASPLVNLGVLEARSGRFDRAEALAARAAELDPLNVTAWLNLARYRLLLGRCEAARDAARRAEAIEPASAGLEELSTLLERCAPPVGGL